MMSDWWTAQKPYAVAFPNGERYPFAEDDLLNSDLPSRQGVIVTMRDDREVAL